MRQEESVYHISMRSDENWNSYIGSKFSKKGLDFQMMGTVAVLFLITFLFFNKLS